MALVESVDVTLGSPLPAFELPDPAGRVHASVSASGERGLLVAVTCNHCPYARAVWPRLIELAKQAARRGVNTLALNPNIHPGYPDDAPEAMREKIKEWGLDFPYLIDETQEVSRTLKAQCTPEFFLYDADRRLVYHGRLDDSWQDAGKVTRQDLKAAIDALAAEEPVAAEQHAALGCSIKWKE
jgi:hypothetical protein